MALNIKNLLASALIALSDQKPLRKITVNDIVEKAGTGRQTFYNHFRDKNDLIYWIFLRTLARERQLVGTRGYYAYLSHLYGEAQKIAPFLAQACAMDDQNSLTEGIYQQTYQYYKNLIVNRYGPEVLTEQMLFALQFNAYGAANTYVQWAKEGMPGSAEEQAGYALACMPDCIRQYLSMDPPNSAAST